MLRMLFQQILYFVTNKIFLNRVEILKIYIVNLNANKIRLINELKRRDYRI